MIGENVKIINSIVWNTADIEDNCEIRDSIIGHKVTIKKGTIINSNCMILSDMIIKESQEIASGSIISLYEYDSSKEKYILTPQSPSDSFEKGSLMTYIPRQHLLLNSE